jgi:CRP-like cAMP-binding protein
MSTHVDPASYIGNVPFFKNLSSLDLISIMCCTQTRIFAKDENLFNQNDPADGLYILRSGKIRIYNFSGIVGENPKVLAEFGPGNYVGEFGFIDGQPRSASVMALEPCEVTYLPAHEFAKLIEQHPDIAQSVTQYLTRMVLNLPQFKIKNSKTRSLMEQGFIEPNLTTMQTLCWAIRESNKKVAIWRK